jgi:hypothetical protein
MSTSKETKTQLCAWMLTMQVQWSDPSQDFAQKVKIHMPQKLKSRIPEDELEKTIHECANIAQDLREKYLNVLADAIFVWGLANYKRTKGMAASDAFDIALNDPSIRHRDIVASTRNLYTGNDTTIQQHDLYQPFLEAVATATIHASRA